MSRSAVVGFISRVTRKIVIGSGRQYLSERGANQRAGEPNGDGGLRYGRKVPEGGAGGERRGESHVTEITFDLR